MSITNYALPGPSLCFSCPRVYPGTETRTPFCVLNASRRRVDVRENFSSVVRSVCQGRVVDMNYQLLWMRIEVKKLVIWRALPGLATIWPHCGSILGDRPTRDEDDPPLAFVLRRGYPTPNDKRWYWRVQARLGAPSTWYFPH